MIPGIKLEKVWFDNDVVEFSVRASDGASLFCTRVYVGHAELDELVASLGRFRNHIHGGIYDIQFGRFGPEIANGAFHARLHFHKPGTLFITVKAESDWVDFKKTQVASRARLYLTSEPILLDNFIDELKALVARTSDEATLVGLSSI